MSADPKPTSPSAPQRQLTHYEKTAALAAVNASDRPQNIRLYIEIEFIRLFLGTYNTQRPLNCVMRLTPNFRTFILKNVLNQQFVGHFRF
jgi:hypothetical protein